MRFPGEKVESRLVIVAVLLVLLVMGREPDEPVQPDRAAAVDTSP